MLTAVAFDLPNAGPLAGRHSTVTVCTDRDSCQGPSWRCKEAKSFLRINTQSRSPALGTACRDGSQVAFRLPLQEGVGKGNLG